MKTIRTMTSIRILQLLSIMLLVGCGSSEQVITDNGEIYEVKGNTFINNGVDVTENLTKDEKDNIISILEEKREAATAAEKLQNELENKKKDLERAQKEAKEKQEELEEKQKELERKLKEKEDAREDVVKAKKRLDSEQKKYEQLKEKGKLSPRDEADWKEKLDKLEEELKTVTEIWNKL